MRRLVQLLHEDIPYGNIRCVGFSEGEQMRRLVPLLLFVNINDHNDRALGMIVSTEVFTGMPSLRPHSP